MTFLLGVICLVLSCKLSEQAPLAHVRDDVTPPLVVLNDQGNVEGTVSEEGYYEFYGIPYADTTEGSHRFKAPLPPPSFVDNFVANRRDVKCVRPVGDGFEGTEDCLVANIITPTLEGSDLAVMVWIKGREFDRPVEHEKSFNEFVKNGVVVVSLNFRESIFGFLCLGTETAPGNAGLKDIIAGLRWIKQNIGKFGGNPDNITLFGHGSGAALVDLVTMSPMAEGLVNQAISQSGNALAPWAVSRDNLKSALQVAAALGHDIDDINTLQQISEIFTRVSVPALIATINEFDPTDSSLVFAPCIEKELAGIEHFLLESPMEILQKGTFLDIPFITGFVDNEGTIKSDEIEKSNWLNRMDENFQKFLPADLKFENEDDKIQVIDNIKEHYFDDNPISESKFESLYYFGDSMVLVPAIREVRLRAAKSTSPIYLYKFSYKGDLGIPFIGPIAVSGTAHSEELGYLFYNAPISEIGDIPDRDLQLVDNIVGRWTAFAKTGNPGDDWKEIEDGVIHYLKFINEEEVGADYSTFLDTTLPDPNSDVMDVWDEIYREHFLDARAARPVYTRDEDDEDDEETVTASPDEDDGDDGDGGGDGDDGDEGDNSDEGDNGDDGDDGDEGDGDGDDEDDEEEDDDNGGPASTAAGYTFIIIAAFTLLEKLCIYIA